MRSSKYTEHYTDTFINIQGNYEKLFLTLPQLCTR